MAKKDGNKAKKDMDETVKKLEEIFNALSDNLLASGKTIWVWRSKKGPQLVWFKEDVMTLAMKQAEDEAKNIN